MKRADELELRIVDILEFVDKEPFQRLGPGATFGTREEIQRLQRKFIDVIEIRKSRGILRF